MLEGALRVSVHFPSFCIVGIIRSTTELSYAILVIVNCQGFEE